MPQATARLPAPSLWHASLRLPDASSSSGHSPRRAEPRRTYSRTPVRSIRRMLANDDELGVWLRRSAHLSDSAVKQSIERLHVEEVFTVADLQVLQRISGFVRVFSPVTAQKVAGALAALEPRTASPAAPHSIAGVRFGGRSRLDFDATLDSARPHAHTPTPWQVLSKDQQLQLIASLRAEDATHALRDDSSSTGGLGSSSPGVRDASSPDAASGGSPVSVMAHGVPETAPLHYRYLGRAVDSPYSGHTPSMHMPLTPRLQAALRHMSTSPVEENAPEVEEAVGACPAYGPMMAQWSHIRCVATLGLSEIIAALLPPYYPLAFRPNCSGWFDDDPRSASHLFGGSLFL